MKLLIGLPVSMALLLGPLRAPAAEIDSRLDSLFGSHTPYEKFLVELKAQVAAQDWSEVAAHAAYPMSVKVSGRRIKLLNRGQFLAHVKTLFTPKVLEAIEAQDYSSLFANATGVMIGNGELWFSSVCSDTRCLDSAVKIIAINP